MSKNKNANAGKWFERIVAQLLGAPRYWANSGEAVDNESEHFVVQSKCVKQMSLSALTALAETAAEDGRKRGKIGLVAIKFRAGRGNRTGTLLVLHENSLAENQNASGRTGRHGKG